jgi:hypothetical protein
MSLDKIASAERGSQASSSGSPSTSQSQSSSTTPTVVSPLSFNIKG